MHSPTHTTKQCLHMADGASVSIAGRVVFYRKLGGVAFGKVVDQNGSIQFCLRKAETPERFKEWRNSVKIGDIVWVKGQTWTSSTGEKSVLVTDDFVILRHSMHPFPNKVSGITDPELKLRKRYLDIVTDPDVKQIYVTRSRVIAGLRHFMHASNFMEVETPILQRQASGAQARPFETHHHAYDTDLYLRIAPETYLKRAVAASFDRVFEIGKSFRNEGADPSHLQEFTSVEWYAAYWDYKDNLSFFLKLLPTLLVEAGVMNGKVHYQGVELDFNNIRTVTYREICLEQGGFDPFELDDPYEVDERFKRDVRPKLVQPTVICDYPAHMSPLAHRSEDGKTVEQWQFVVNGWELVKCYTELTDPVLQRQLLEEQMAQRASGDHEAMMLEEDFLECMEYGMPPMSGLGLGLDRLVALLTNQTTLRNVVLFPTVL